MNTHDGHRKRIRERYLQEGLDGFAEHEVLELLLTFAIPRRDTNEIAHSLIREFGSLHAVLDTPSAILSRVDGVGENATTLLALICDVERRYRLSKFGRQPILDTTLKQAKFCQALQFNNSLETTYLVCLSSRKKLLSFHKLDEGNFENVPIYISKIIQKAMVANTNSILFTHNHPGGDPVPSDNDIRTTFQIIQALRAVELRLEDHIIVGDGDMWVSLRESKCI